MKKKLFFLAVAAVALASCSNDETIASQANSEANEISFRPFTTGVTRAADITSDNITSFRVSAFQTGGTSTDYFRNVDFIKNGTTFTSANKIYWPSGFNLDFYAYAPISTAVVGSDKQIVPTSDGTTYDANSYNTFKVTPASGAVPTNDQVDLVYAKAKNWGKITESEDQHDGTNGVSINFRHAESKVVVKLKNSNTNLYFTVKDVEIRYLASTGVFTYPTGTDIETYGQGSYLNNNYWTSNNDNAGVYQIANTANTEFSTANPYGFEQILIPQTLTAATTYDKGNDNEYSQGNPFHGPYIMVEYKVQNGDGNGAYIVGAENNNDPNNNPEYVRAIWPLSTITWYPGYKYTYTVDLAGGGYYETNQDTDADLDPILGGSEIMFAQVTVDAWANSDVLIVKAGSTQTITVPYGYASNPYKIIVNGLTATATVTATGTNNFTASPTITSSPVPASGIVEISGALTANNNDEVTSVVTITETGGRNTVTTVNIVQEQYNQ